MNKKAIKNVIGSHSTEDIAQYLIYEYAVSKGLNWENSPVLSSFFHSFDFRKNKFNSLEINSLKELESHLELLIPEKDRKLNGAFFTPNYIVDFIINEVEPKENDRCLDPSCGTGAFLIGLVEYYIKKYNKTIKCIIRENIFGSDILGYNIKRAKILLALFALENGEYLEENDFNLYTQDSLRSEWNEQFDVVVGNPPYVKYQDLSDENRTYLIKEWDTIQSGTFNLYFAFFELGYQLLTPIGRLGYITPNNYFTSLAGKNLRAFFVQNKCVSRIIDFSHKKVFDAQTYTAITFLNKNNNNSILYDRIKDKDTPEEFVAEANGSPNHIGDLNIKKWRLLKTDEQKNIKIIENIGTPIKSLFDICVGIATLKDEVFFVDERKVDDVFLYKNTPHGKFKIEREVTKPVYKISDFKSQDEVKGNSRRIIFPYTIQANHAQAIPETEFSKKYPKCYEYLSSQKEILESRDKGKVKFEPFYVWGRTQGLTKRGRKILNPTFSKYPRFLLVENEEAFFTNGYGIYFRENTNGTQGLFSEFNNLLKSEENIDVVQKILNSYVMHYYVSTTSVSIAGGYPCYQKNFIEKFTIPTLSEPEIQFIRGTTDKKEIDDFLIQKYGIEIQLPNLVS